MPSKDSGNNATNNITATLRTEFGKGAARRARRDGLVPAVLYGHATEPRHLALVARDFAAVLRNNGTNAVLTLDIEGEEQVALTKSIVVHPIRRNIEHADLMVLKVGERVTVEVNIVVTGDAEAGSLVTTEATVLEIEADALKIPEQIEISVEEVAIGTQILAGSVVLPEGVTLISDPEMLVVNVVPAPTDEELESEGAGTAEIGDEPDEIQTEDDAEGSSDES